MPRFLGEGFRTGAFRTAAAFAVLLLAAVAAASLFPADPSFSQETRTGTPSKNSSGKDSTSTSNANPQKPKEGDPDVKDPTSGRDVVLLTSLLSFAIIFMGTTFFGFRNHIREKSGEIERIGIVTVLVVGALYLVTSGFGTQKAAPAFALFGTVAGYLLGQVGSRKCRSDGCREIKTTEEKNA